MKSILLSGHYVTRQGYRMYEVVTLVCRVVIPEFVRVEREKREKRMGRKNEETNGHHHYASGPKRAANHLNQASHTPGGRAVVLHPNGAAAKYYRYMERKGGCGS